MTESELQVLEKTEFNLPLQTHFYKGKVRDVYTISNKYLVMVASDRISAFDHILPRCIPYKGQVLNQIASHFLNETRHIIQNWLISTPDPHVSIGHICEPIKIEMVIRGYLAGHAWRTYRDGKRELCGVKLPDGLKENDPLPSPIITPSTKADEGHDEDISADEILKQGIVSKEVWDELCLKTYELFKFGSKRAQEQDLILVDTKYEFGILNGELCLIDEIHTPDSSRYFYAHGYTERQKNGEPQEQLSKEFVRQWLIEHNFQGLEGQKMPNIPDTFVKKVSNRYMGLYKSIVGAKFEGRSYLNIHQKVEENILKALTQL